MLDTWDLFNAKTTQGSDGSFFLVVAETRLRPAAASQPQTSPFRRVFMLLTTNVENMKCYSFFFPLKEKKSVYYMPLDSFLWEVTEHHCLSVCCETVNWWCSSQ